MSQHFSRRILIANKLGLHARAATKLAKLAAAFDARVIIRQGDKEADANSVMGLLLLAGQQGREVEIQTSGPEAKAALEAICELISNRFDETE